MPLPSTTNLPVIKNESNITLLASDLNKNIVGIPSTINYPNGTYTLPTATLIGKGFGYPNSFQFTISNFVTTLGKITLQTNDSNILLLNGPIEIASGKYKKFLGSVDQVKNGAIITYKIKIMVIGYN